MKIFLKNWKFEKRRFDTRFLVLIPLGILIFFNISNYLILIYYFFQKDIIFSATGWFPMFETIHWYYIFLGLLTLQMLIVFLTYRFTKYMKNFSFGTEKQKIIALYLLIGVNLLTIPMNFPLIWNFFAYLSGKEILSNNWFFGTFRRVLNENERYKLYEESVKNVLEKTQASKEIKDQLKIWAYENTKSMLEKYDAGSAFATEYISENLESQKEFLQLEEIKKLDTVIKIADCVENTDKDQQGWFPWIYDQTMKGFNYLNPFSTDLETCVLAWLCVILVISIGVYMKSSTSADFPSNFANIPAQADEIIDLKNLVCKIDAILQHVLDLGDINPQMPENILLAGEMIKAQQEIKRICRSIANTSGFNQPDWIPPIPLSQQKKTELIANILQEYEGPQWASTNMALEIFENLVTSC